MAGRIVKPCAYPRCPVLVPIGTTYCDKHQKIRNKQQHPQSASAQGYGYRWRKARARYLRDHPLCVKCKEENRTRLATVVDHIIPHKGDMKLFWDSNNWQSLCKECHDRKTATEDGGFGHPLKG